MSLYPADVNLQSLSFILVFSLVFASCSKAPEQVIHQSEALKEGDKFPSPDNKFVATFVGGGFEIQAAAGGEPALVPSLPPVYLAQWTPDSKTLATVEHLANGSDAVFIHQVAGQWVRADSAPDAPEDYPHQAYHVLKLDMAEGGVNVIYEVTEANGAPIAKSSDLPAHQVGVRFSPVSASLLEPQVKLGNQAFVLLPEAGKTELLPMEPGSKAPGPVANSGYLAVDTDGVGPSHGDVHQQKQTSGILDMDGKLVPRYLLNGKKNPAGVTEVNADLVAYGVVPKNLAQVNGGPLKVGDQIEVSCPNGKHVVTIGDFGPLKKWGEVSYRGILDFKYKIVPWKYGPLPSPDGKNTPDIKVTVTYTLK